MLIHDAACSQQSGDDDAIAQDFRAAVEELGRGVTVDVSAGLADIERRAARRSGGVRGTVARRSPDSLPGRAAPRVIATAVAVAVLALMLPSVIHTGLGEHPSGRPAISSPPASMPAPPGSGILYGRIVQGPTPPGHKALPLPGNLPPKLRQLSELQ
jgi:hypothetical protein